MLTFILHVVLSALMFAGIVLCAAWLVSDYVDACVAEMSNNINGRINKIVDDVNAELKKIGAKFKEVDGKVQGNQGKLDSFKREIGNNGVFNRLKALENKMFTWNHDARLEALEDFMNITPVINTEKRIVQVPGMHYEKVGKNGKNPTTGCGLSVAATFGGFATDECQLKAAR